MDKIGLGRDDVAARWRNGSIRLHFKEMAILPELNPALSFPEWIHLYNQ